MRELPILFSTPMVQAILENRKTMTRRTAGLERVNEKPYNWILARKNDMTISNVVSGEMIILNPRCNIGDRLWVKETFFDTRKYQDAPLFANGPEYIYRADKDAFIGEHKWKPSLFMPKVAARIWLEVTGIRCERLQNISEADAIAEGVECIGEKKLFKYKNYLSRAGGWIGAATSFLSLWQSINGKDSWELNPWVFVYEFKQINK